MAPRPGDDFTAKIGADASGFEREMRKMEREAQVMGARFARSLSGLSNPPRVQRAVFFNEGQNAGRAFADGLVRGLAGRDPFLGLTSTASTVAAGLGAAVGGREAIQAADAWQNAANRLKLVAGNAELAAAYHRQLFQVAQETRVEVGATSQLYYRLAASTRNLAPNQRELLDVTKAVNQAFAISGATAQEAKGAIQQFGQALASNRLGGEEFRSISEQAPRLRDAIAESLDVSIGKLRELAEAGQLTSDVVFRGILEQAPQIAAEFEYIEATIGGAWQTLVNAVEKYIGETSQSTGASRMLAEAIQSAARNFETLVDLALALAAITAGRIVGNGFSVLNTRVRETIRGFREQRQEIVQLSFARQADAAAEMAAAQRSEAATTRRIRNLQRVIEAQKQAMLAESGQLLAYHNIVGGPNASIDRDERGRFRSKAERIRITQALAAANIDLERTERRLHQLDIQRDRNERRLVALRRQLPGLNRQVAATTDVATRAGQQHDQVLRQMTRSATAWSVAKRGAAAALNMLGGPIGVAMIAITALTYVIMKQKQAVEDAKRAMEDWMAQLSQLSQEERIATMESLRKQQTEALADQQKLRAEVERLNAIPPSNRTNMEHARLIDQSRLLELNINRTKQLGDMIRQVQAVDESEARRKSRLGADESSLDRQIKELAELRQNRLARVEHYQHIEQIVRSHRARLAELQAQYPLGIEEESKRRAEILKIQSQIELLTKPLERPKKINIEADFRDLVQELQGELEKQEILLKVAADERTAPSQALQLREQALESILDLEQRVNWAIEDRADLQARFPGIFADLLKLRQVLEHQFDLPAISFKEFKPVEIPVTTVVVPGSFDDLRRQLEQTKFQINIAELLGYEDLEREAQDRRSLRIRRLVEQLQAGNVSAEGMEETFKKMGIDAEDIRRAFGLIEQTMAESVSIGLRGFVRILDTVSDVGEELDDMLQAIDDLVTGIQQFQKLREDTKNSGGLFGNLSNSLASISSIIGMVGAVASLLQGIGVFGGLSEDELEDRRIRQQNNEEMRRLSDELSGFRNSLGDITRAQETLAALMVTRQWRGIDIGEVNVLDQIARLEMLSTELQQRLANEILEPFGMTMEDLRRVAEANGIDILDDKGRIVAGSLDQLRVHLERVREELITWSNSLQDITRRMEAEADLWNVDLEDPVNAWRQQIEALGQMDFGAAFDMLKDLDINTAEGRAQAQAAIQAIWTAINSDTDNALKQAFKASGFESIEEFTDWILRLEDPLDKFRDSVEKATNATTNVPEGWRITLRRFQSLMAAPDELAPDVAVKDKDLVEDSMIQLADTIRGRTRIIDDALTTLADTLGRQRRLEAEVGGGRTRPGEATVASGLHVEQLTVQIVARDHESGRQTLERLIPAIEERARSRGGSSAPITLGLER